MAVELGAGWAPWLVAVARAAELKGIQNVRLVGVEGSEPHYEYMVSHFADNGLDPEEHTLLHGVVGTTDGTAEFPVFADPSVDWGASVLYPDVGNLSGRLGRRIARVTRMMAERLRTASVDASLGTA